MNVLVLVVIVMALAIPAHMRLTSFTIATVAPAFLAAIIYQAIVTIRLGYVDKLVDIALIVSVIIGLLVASIVGVALRLWTGRHTGDGRQGPS